MSENIVEGLALGEEPLLRGGEGQCSASASLQVHVAGGVTCCWVKGVEIQDDQEKANGYLNLEECSGTSQEDHPPQGQFPKEGNPAGHHAVLIHIHHLIKPIL